MEPYHDQGLSAFLKRLQLRSVLTDEEKNAVLHLKGHVELIADRQDLVVPGETVTCAILVISGMLARFDLMKEGSRQITAFYIPGDMCDLHSVVAPTTGWGITALGAATVFRIPHPELKKLVSGFPNLALAFWRDTTLDASVLAKWVANIGRKDARARVAHLLCEMGVRMEAAGLGTKRNYRLDITQEQIGDAMGLSPVHVNRTLQGLRALGVVSVKNNQVQIADWDRLASIAEFTSTFLLFDEQQKNPD